MPSLLDLRRRIRAVKSTQQITKAMKMISASKLRRAQERVVGARPFALQMQRVLNSVASRVDSSTHPSVGGAGAGTRCEGAADRGHGRQGALRRVQHQHHQGRQQLHRLRGQRRTRGGGHRIQSRVGAGRPQRPRLLQAARVRSRLRGSRHLSEGALRRRAADCAGGDRRVHHRPRWQGLHRVQRVQVGDAAARRDRAAAADPDGVGRGRWPRERQGVRPRTSTSPVPSRSSRSCCRSTSRSRCIAALLESAAAEHAARMTAMDAASKNSGEIIDTLTLYMNKVRQAAITREIIEVVSGACSNRLWALDSGANGRAQSLGPTKREETRSNGNRGCERAEDRQGRAGHRTGRRRRVCGRRTCPTSTTPCTSCRTAPAAARRSTSCARSSSTWARRACERLR